MKIFVQGFKSLLDGQYIALGNKLTFLVGPNSAGKSTLKLVLDKLNGDSPVFELDTKLIYRNPNKSNQVASFHAIGVEWTHKENIVKFIHQYQIGNNLSETEINSVNILDKNILFEYCGEKIGSNPDDISTSMRKIISGDFGLIKIEEGVNSPFFRSLVFFGEKAEFREIYLMPSIDFISNYPNVIESLSECAEWQVEITRSIKEENPSLFAYVDDLSEQWPFFWIGFLLKKQISISFKGKLLQQKLNQFERHKAIIEKYVYKTLKDISSSYPRGKFSVALASAKRTLPNESELSWLQQPRIFIRPQSAKEVVAYYLPEKVIPDNLDSYQALMTSKTLLLKVNQALAENMFMDNGYQIRVESKILVTEEDWQLRAKNEEYEIHDPSKFHQISLRDAHGRHLSFEDVGSGIGYVLPVLIEAFRESNLYKVVFLQQPELHLHPALQANLTDVLIEASANKRIVAETHSEHMILRALKRVRQTSANTLKDPNLKLTPEDIAVNYFEPLPDGSTRVHILRVSEEGDFLDRWPNGFFAERDQELFDE